MMILWVIVLILAAFLGLAILVRCNRVDIVDVTKAGDYEIDVTLYIPFSGFKTARGSGTVYHWKESGMRCPTDIESLCNAQWIKFRWSTENRHSIDLP